MFKFKQTPHTQWADSGFEIKSRDKKLHKNNPEPSCKTSPHCFSTMKNGLVSGLEVLPHWDPMNRRPQGTIFLWCRAISVILTSISLNEVWLWTYLYPLLEFVFKIIHFSHNPFFHQQEPKINSFSEEGYKLDAVKGNIVFKNIHFTYPSRQDVKVGPSKDLLKTIWTK